MTTNSTSTIKLTDAQLVALSTASQRADRCIIASDHLKGGAIAKVAERLIAKGVAEEIEAAPGMPIIRRDGEQAFARLITAAGFAALGIEAQDATDASHPPHVDLNATLQRDGDASPAEDGAGDGDSLIPTDTAAGGSAGTSVSARSSAPREGTKLAQVIALLERAEGANIGDLTTATGWLAHTTRAALTGLRKRGYTVELVKGADGQESSYRIAAMPIIAKAA